MSDNRVALDALTGLRFVAAGMIVVWHTASLNIPVPAVPWAQGVSFFFVLSGFIIAYTYPKLEGKADTCKFLAARMARLWPTHFVTLLLVLLFIPSSLNRTLVANIFLVQAWVPSWPWYFSYNAPSWSISTELFFYLAFPVLILNWERSWWWKWIASALLVLLLTRLGTFLHLPAVSQQDEPTLHGLLLVNPVARLFEFTTGMVTFLAYRRLKPNFGELNPAIATALEVCVIAVAAFFIVDRSFPGFVGRHLPAAEFTWFRNSGNVWVFALVVLVFAFGRGWLSRFFGSGPMKLLGEMSFAIYLVHTIVFNFYHFHVIALQTDGGRPAYLGLAICIGITLVIAFLIWAVVETPCRAAAKRLLKRPRPTFRYATMAGETPARSR